MQTAAAIEHDWPTHGAPLVAAGARIAGSDEEPVGLAGTLGSVLETMRDTLAYPAWSLSEADIGRALGQAQQLRALADTLTAVLAGEADTRGLGAADGLSRADWLRTVAPDLEPAAAPAL